MTMCCSAVLTYNVLQVFAIHVIARYSTAGAVYNYCVSAMRSIIIEPTNF